MDYKKIFKRETKTIAYVVICLTLVIISASYAMFLQVNNNNDNQVVETGSLVITYTNKNGDVLNKDTDAITDSTCLEPMTDDEAEAMTNCSYYLNIFNKGSLPASYRLVMFNNQAELPSGGTFVNHNAMKVSVKKGNGGSYNPIENNPFVLGTLPHSSDTQFKTAQNEVKYVLDEGTLEAASDISYNIQAWIHEDLATSKLTGQYVYLKLEVTSVVSGEAPITNAESGASSINVTNPGSISG